MPAPHDGQAQALLYLDTHAGAGAYRLNEGYSTQTGNGRRGLGRLAGRLPGGSVPAPVQEYLRFLEEFGRDHPGEFPGSPALVGLLRPGIGWFSGNCTPRTSRSSSPGSRRIPVPRSGWRTVFRG
ncbi:MAG: 23S rRNA (adenine(2030)-N(6))-methyltransferase RlmJ [Desulfomicrobium escambiense]|nr:23S rRNA (adenine(2030)-N(6))-methyltransferase RlmJ [Desulfomicrobium escambiense]